MDITKSEATAIVSDRFGLSLEDASSNIARLEAMGTGIDIDIGEGRNLRFNVDTDNGWTIKQD